MWFENSMSIGEAIDKGIVIVREGSIISPTIRIVYKEDDGKNYGVIFVGKNTIIRENAIICSDVKIG